MRPNPALRLLSFYEAQTETTGGTPERSRVHRNGQGGMRARVAGALTTALAGWREGDDVAGGVEEVGVLILLKVVGARTV